jgi:molecular chaperone Hsp33
MNTLKKQYQHRDRVVRVMSRNGMFRAAATNISLSVKSAVEKHQLDPISSYLLGKTMASAVLLSSFLKGEERVIVQVEGSGNVRTLFAEALQVGEVRGYATINQHVTMPQTLSEVLGKGFFKVSKVLYDKSDTVTGIISLVKGDISSELASYFEQSEQIVTSVNLGTTINDNAEIEHCGGIIVQAMPGASISEIVEVQRSIEDLPSIEELLDDGYSPEEILKQAMPFEIDIVNNTPVDFFCRCSLKKFMDNLIALGKTEIESMKNEQQHELICQYCNSKYYLAEEDFAIMLSSF